MKTYRPTMLVILDGWGWREDDADNAVKLAKTPVFDGLWQNFPHTLIKASGKDVGLPDGQMGNSEVGHLNIGAGRVVMQDLPRITDAMDSGEIARMPGFVAFVNKMKQSGGTCHLMGLLSDGGVHGHLDHALALTHVLAREGINTCVHVFSDGRDTAPFSGAEYLAKFEAALPAGVTVATVCGRYFAMDRDKRWDRVAKAYAALVCGHGEAFDSASAVLAAAYAANTGDEFVNPAVVGDYAGMNDGDGVLCFNFRADRVREILAAMLQPSFDGFERAKVVNFAAAAGMTRYSDELAALMDVVFLPQSLDNGLGQTVAKAGLRQLRTAESEKYPHVTYFLNGGEEQPYAGEERILVASPKVATYDLQPEMSCPELTEKAVAAINSGTFDLIVLNYANPDMVGHTGDLNAAMKAVEAVDTGLGKLVAAVRAQGGALVVTADHGNCELMRDPVTKGPHTAHTTNLVPVIVVSDENVALQPSGRLADLAPTLLHLLGVDQPAEMTGVSLITS